MSYNVIKHGEKITMDKRALISKRYKAITKAVNQEFWGISSDTAHSLYVGSYGRNTAIDTSDIDVLVELPEAEYQRYNVQKGNGQSRLLQAVKGAIQNTYPRTEIRGDGQVVKVLFTDGMKIEVLPAFASTYWSGRTTYRYPDSNMGGNWCSTDPKAEQDAIYNKNNSSAGLLLDTCKHMRYIRDEYYSSYHLSGIVIDSFAYLAIGDWHWADDSTSSTRPISEYERTLYDYYIYNYQYSNTILAPGSNQLVDFRNSKECLEKVLRKMSQ